MKFQRLIKLASLMLLVMLLASNASAAPPGPGNQPKVTISQAPTATSATRRMDKGQASPPSGLYRGLKMASATDGWIVGQGGLIKRYMAGQWLDYPSPVTTTLDAVAATATDAWAVGEGNTILHLVGSNWQVVASPAPAGSSLLDVDIVAPGEVWIIGSPAVMLHYSGGSWLLGPNPPVVGPISWGSPSDAWLVDGTSTAYHYFSGSWTATNLYGIIAVGVFMLSPNLGWIGTSSFSFDGTYPIEYLRYTSPYGWSAWPPGSCPPQCGRSGGYTTSTGSADWSSDGSCVSSAGCSTTRPAAQLATTPAVPGCRDRYADIYNLIAFTTTDFYAAADETIDDCISYGDNYYPLWYNLVSYNPDLHLGDTYTHTVALSGSSGNDLWLLGNNTIRHWDGTNITVAPSCANPYTDVPANYYALAQIEYLTCHNIVNGAGNHVFSPNAPATRIQFAKMISLARGWPLATPSNGQSFSDVPPSNPLYAYVETAYQNGALSGASAAMCVARQATYPCFLPNDPVSRAQTAVITQRAFGWPIDTTGGPHFSDVSTSNFAYDAVETCYNRGVISGIGGGLFAPNQSVTRAQLARILYGALIQP
jgi:S-layer homology domain